LHLRLKIAHFLLLSVVQVAPRLLFIISLCNSFLHMDCSPFMFVVSQLQTADLLFKDDHFVGTGSQTGSMVVPKRLYLLAEGHHFPFGHLCSAQTSFSLPA